MNSVLISLKDFDCASFSLLQLNQFKSQHFAVLETLLPVCFVIISYLTTLGTDDQTQTMILCGVIPALGKLIKHSSLTIQKEAVCSIDTSSRKKTIFLSSPIS